MTIASRLPGLSPFRWNEHPIALRSSVVATARPHSFAFVADALHLHRRHYVAGQAEATRAADANAGEK
jgi:hypothetical protein